MTTKLRLNHMSLRVRNLTASATFYQDVLLLPEIDCGAALTHIRWFGLGAGQSIHLIEGDFSKTFVTISTHFCISPADYEGMVRHLRAKGVVYCDYAGQQGKEQLRADGVRSVYVQDPDGYWIEINEEY